MEEYIRERVGSEILGLKRCVKRSLEAKDVENKALKDKVNELEELLKHKNQKQCEVCEKKDVKFEELKTHIETTQTMHELEETRLKGHVFKRQGKIKELTKILYERDEAIEKLEAKIETLLKEYNYLNEQIANETSDEKDSHNHKETVANKTAHYEVTPKTTRSQTPKTTNSQVAPKTTKVQDTPKSTCSQAAPKTTNSLRTRTPGPSQEANEHAALVNTQPTSANSMPLTNPITNLDAAAKISDQNFLDIIRSRTKSKGNENEDRLEKLLSKSEDDDNVTHKSNSKQANKRNSLRSSKRTLLHEETTKSEIVRPMIKRSRKAKNGG